MSRIWISGYRSIHNVKLELSQLNVVTGANGVGKSNLYKSLSLIAHAVNGGLARALAEEGGMPSVLWTGPRLGKKPVRLKLGFSIDEFSFELAAGLRPHHGPSESSFELTLGLPPQGATIFRLDPEVKEEFVWHGMERRPTTTFLKRNGSIVELTREGSRPDELVQNILITESALSQVQQPELYPVLAHFAHEVGGWRFYHHFDTSPTSPLRTDQVSTYSPVLDEDGRNLAAALQTINEIGDRDRLINAIDQAFPGCFLAISEHGKARLGLALNTPGLLRQLEANELSDGTLRFLCLAAALMTPRPPSLLAFNEPETSLHPDLLPPLANLIVNASSHSQVWVTTHSTRLAELIGEQSEFRHIHLQLQDGATIATVAEESR